MLHLQPARRKVDPDLRARIHEATLLVRGFVGQRQSMYTALEDMKLVWYLLVGQRQGETQRILRKHELVVGGMPEKCRRSRGRYMQIQPVAVFDCLGGLPLAEYHGIDRFADRHWLTPWLELNRA